MGGAVSLSGMAVLNQWVGLFHCLGWRCLISGWGCFTVWHDAVEFVGGAVSLSGMSVESVGGAVSLSGMTLLNLWVGLFHCLA